MPIQQDLGFHLFFLCFNRHLGALSDCCCLGMTCVCRHHDMIFICFRTIQTSKIYLISDNKSN